MIVTSEQDLRLIAKTQGYRPEILEKVYRLLDLLEIFMATPLLREKLVLKGGTAINLFCSNQLPRLSLDLDFNYIGGLDREIMLDDKKELYRVILEICRRQGYELYRNPQAHAGGKMVLIYSSLLGTKGRLELDLNYQYRAPLWKVVMKHSECGLKRVETTILDIHELAAGKLHALLEREASRDLFDSHQLLNLWDLDNSKLRLAFTVYAGMRKLSWRKMSADQIQFNIKDIRNKLIPVLNENMIPGTLTKEIQAWAEKLVAECKDAFQSLLPFNESEKAFLTEIEERGEIRPELISSDDAFCAAVKNHPALLWRIRQLEKLRVN